MISIGLAIRTAVLATAIRAAELAVLVEAL